MLIGGYRGLKPSKFTLAKDKNSKKDKLLLDSKNKKRNSKNPKQNDLEIKDPSSPLILVNKEQGLTEGFIPDDLVIPNIPFSFNENLPKKQMKKIAARAIERLFSQAKKDKIDIVGVSAYRSYQRQKDIFAYNAKKDGVTAANKYSAHAGHSEHQTGLAIDVSSPKVNYKLIEEFGGTKEGRWLQKNAPTYGFIIRYPKDKEEITGYQYEPWHLRYVGVEHALAIANKDSTLENYLYS
ncbi:D-alanyl-D-alanine carboxypeptidase [Orenia marismortui]|uniref:D-alanyl-D-alanine carboxypeptidase n=1 Tax=Orenia marismortui TaxID=46469 RepID=A0A4R8GZS6_9FIRM|nr:D-alanyl-D-alanine carboxypeptidase [Orenia marismortui]